MEKQQQERSNRHRLQEHQERQCPWLFLFALLFSPGSSTMILRLHLREILHYRRGHGENWPKEGPQGLIEAEAFLELEGYWNISDDPGEQQEAIS